MPLIIICPGYVASACVSASECLEKWKGTSGTWEYFQIILRLRRVMNPKVYSIGFLASLTAAVLVVIVMVALAEYTKTRGRALLTALVLTAYFFSSLGPVWLAHRKPGSSVFKVALGVATAALLLILIGVWGTPNSDAFWKSTAIIAVLGLVLAYFSVINWKQEDITRSFGVRIVALAAFMGCLGIAAGINWPPYWWVFTLAVIVWVGSLLLFPLPLLWRRIQRR